jgi:hypothetical protein
MDRQNRTVASRPRHARHVLALLLGATLLLGLALTPPSEAGRRWSESSDKTGPPGDLAIIGFELFEVGSPGVHHRVLARIQVENQSPLNLETPFTVRVVRDGRRIDEAEALSRCRGEALPRGQIAICDIWLPGDAVDQGDSLVAVLDRSDETFDAWDGDVGDDSRTAMMRTRTGSRGSLRVASWEVRPRILHGMGEVQFSFTVEGAHLVWVMTEQEDQPRLVAGHPADGLLSGKGTLRIRDSGPITIVARNSLGGFVYAAIPVLNSYQAPKPSWGRETPAAEVDGYVTPRILDPGVYEDDDNEIVLQSIRTYLEAKNWTAALERLRRLDQQDEEPRPASVLNPRARDF